MPWNWHFLGLFCSLAKRQKWEKSLVFQTKQETLPLCIKGKDFFRDATFSFGFLGNCCLGKAPKHPEERTFLEKKKCISTEWWDPALLSWGCHEIFHRTVRSDVKFRLKSGLKTFWKSWIPVRGDVQAPCWTLCFAMCSWIIGLTQYIILERELSRFLVAEGE